MEEVCSLKYMTACTQTVAIPKTLTGCKFNKSSYLYLKAGLVFSALKWLTSKGVHNSGKCPAVLDTLVVLGGECEHLGTRYRNVTARPILSFLSFQR